MSQDGIGYQASNLWVWGVWGLTLPVQGTETFKNLAENNAGAQTKSDALVMLTAKACLDGSSSNVDKVKSAWGALWSETIAYFKQGQFSRVAGLSLALTSVWLSRNIFLGSAGIALLLLRNCKTVTFVLKGVDLEKNRVGFCGGAGLTVAALWLANSYSETHWVASLTLPLLRTVVAALTGMMTAVWFVSKPESIPLNPIETV